MMDENIIKQMHPLEKKIIPLLEDNIDFNSLNKKTELEEIQIMRALQWLSNKNILNINESSEEIVSLDDNGIIYKEKGLPERRFLETLKKIGKEQIILDEILEHSDLEKNEINICIGMLKKKLAIDISKQGKELCFSITKRGRKIIEEESLEEKFLQKKFPKKIKELEDIERFAFDELKKRKQIVKIERKKTRIINLTEEGKELLKSDSAKNMSNKEEIGKLTSKIISSESWKKDNVDFRSYDIKADVPEINGGKKHFVNQSIEYGKRIWLEMGFKEMTGTKSVTSFWNFDALFTAQDHPVREMQDTFFIKNVKGKLPDQKIVNEVKKAHEGGIENSKGWQYKWSEEDAKKVLIRTHTTCLSSQTLCKLKKEDLPAKFFAIGKCFRNETVDWSHGFEFNQSEGIVIDPNANLRNLIGYLKEFAKKMGYEKIRIQPAYFPYTEPSLEGAVWNEEKQEWVEVLAAGIFRPEVTKPLLGEAIPVLAWGPGFDRLMMKAYEISDLRELYKNNIKDLKNKKYWIK